jgi:hypothetical protein
MYKYLLILTFISISFFAFPAKPLSDGYKDIKLGMTQAQVKGILDKSVDFSINKEEILTMRLEPDTEIISTEGLGFIISGYFHFSHDQLFQILLKLSETKIGYYYILNKFTNSFGKPNKLDPEKATWENDKIRITLEKPCTLKYIYLPVWNGLVKEKEKNDLFEKDREKFVDGL